MIPDRCGGVNLTAIETLLIHDSSLAPRIIVKLVQQVGRRVVGEAESAAQVIKLFHELKPQCVTLDLIMPATEGIDPMTALQTMRKEDPAAAIIVVTSVCSDQTRKIVTEGGALAYVIKPFN